MKEVCKQTTGTCEVSCEMHSLPWQVKRLVVQSVQIVSGTPNFVIIIIQHYLWVTSHVAHLKHQTFFISISYCRYNSVQQKCPKVNVT